MEPGGLFVWERKKGTIIIYCVYGNKFFAGRMIFSIDTLGTIRFLRVQREKLYPKLFVLHDPIQRCFDIQRTNKLRKFKLQHTLVLQALIHSGKEWTICESMSKTKKKRENDTPKERVNEVKKKDWRREFYKSLAWFIQYLYPTWQENTN